MQKEERKNKITKEKERKKERNKERKKERKKERMFWMAHYNIKSPAPQKENSPGNLR